MRDLTPAYTIISSQADEPNSVLNSPSLPAPRAVTPAEQSLIDLTLDADGDDTEMEDVYVIDEDDASLSSSSSDEEDDASLDSSDPNIKHPLLRFSSSYKESKRWTKNATIRHTDLVLFSFCHIAAPEDGEALRGWLNSVKPASDNPQDLITSILVRDTNAVTITMNGVLQLENLWTRTDHQPSPEHDHPILAWIWFRSYLKPGDWQVVREIFCITVSQPAFRELLKLAGVAQSPHANEWIAHLCDCLTTDAQSLRSLCGRESIASAASSLSLRLETFWHNNGEVHFRWAKQADNTTADAERLYHWISESSKTSLDASLPGCHSRKILEELLPRKVVPSFLRPLLRIPSRFGKQGAALLKQPASWPAGRSPMYCLMVSDETGFDDEPALCQKIVRLSKAGDLYRPIGEEVCRITVSGYDKCLISVWTDILSGKTSPNTEWPLGGFEGLFDPITVC
jgi:hypothetical protein